MKGSLMSCNSLLLISCNLLVFLLVEGDLVVNVRNQGGEVYKEEIHAEVEDETISLSFESPGDGTKVFWFIDFKNEIQIIQTDGFGEEEILGDPPFLSYCFVTKFNKGDFIPPDAMAKLRQKNPWSIRIPERTLPPASNSSLDSLLDITSSDWISPHLKTVCKDSLTYTSKVDLISNYEGNGNNSESFLRAVRPVLSASEECSNVPNPTGVPCICSHPICIGWYPCALKYCRTKGADNNEGEGEDGSGAKTYRCGIHTCKSCRNYVFSVSNKFNCLT